MNMELRMEYNNKQWWPLNGHDINQDIMTWH